MRFTDKELELWVKIARWLHGIRRSLRFFWQRRTRGWDDSECCSLDFTLANMIAPRLKRLREISVSYACLCPKHYLKNGYEHTDLQNAKCLRRWDLIVGGMQFAFEAVADEELDVWWTKDKNLERKVRRGLDLFAKYYGGLWD